MKTKHIVYMATCKVNGHSYVGMTGKGLVYRKNRHIYQAIRGHKGCPKFYDAIRKHGPENFLWMTLWAGSSHAECEEKEIYFIKFFNPKYNVDIGGRGGAIGRKAHNRKKVLCLNDGKLYDSAAAAAGKYQVSSADISANARSIGRRREVKGLSFLYTNESIGKSERDIIINERKIAKVEERKRRVGELKHPRRLDSKRRYDSLGRKITGPRSRMRKVQCIDDGKTFSSAGEAAEYYGISLTSIRELCLGQRNRATAGGKRFKYVEQKP